jgi:YidC/Oxa1 family membrane protein insertase
MNIFDTLLVAPIVNLLALFYFLFEKLGVPGGLGFAIIAVTSLLRLAINPLMKHQTEQSQKMQALAPAVKKLQEKYKKDAVKLQQAQAELYKSHNINPGFGCLIFLIQLPLFIGLYNALIRLVTTNGSMDKMVEGINKLLYHPAIRIESLHTDFFGFNLVAHPNEWQKFGWWYLLIPVLTAALQFYQSYLTTKSLNAGKKEEKKTEKKDKNKKDEPDMQSIMQKQMMFMFPLMIGYFSYNFPVGLALYWNIFTLFGIWQYASMKPLSLPKKN